MNQYNKHSGDSITVNNHIFDVKAPIDASMMISLATDKYAINHGGCSYVGRDMVGILMSTTTSSTIIAIVTTSATSSNATEVSAILEQAMVPILMTELFNSNGNDISRDNFDSIINKDTVGDFSIHIGSNKSSAKS